jgi:hypothetical protein
MTITNKRLMELVKLEATMDLANWITFLNTLTDEEQIALAECEINDKRGDVAISDADLALINKHK